MFCTVLIYSYLCVCVCVNHCFEVSPSPASCKYKSPSQIDKKEEAEQDGAWGNPSDTVEKKQEQQRMRWLNSTLSPSYLQSRSKDWLDSSLAKDRAPLSPPSFFSTVCFYQIS